MPKSWAAVKDWAGARVYHLLSPLVALAVVALLSKTSLILERFESPTISYRFLVRSTFDPPADPRLIFVGIDEPSLAHFGKWPWPRRVEATFLDTIARSDYTPHTVAFDVMFTEDSDKLVTEKQNTDLNDDVVLGQAIGELPSVVSGAYTPSEPTDKGVTADEVNRTKAEFKTAGPTEALTNVKGDISHLHGSDIAALPVQSIRTQSLWGFVNDDPSPVDDIRHTVPLVLRVADKVYPALALQTLCQILNIDAKNVEVNLPERYILLKNSSGKHWRIPVNSRAEFAINYRSQQQFRNLSFFYLLSTLYDHTATGAPVPAQCDIKNKTLFIGESATALGDLGPSPLASRSPLPYVHLNVMNNVLKNDYLSFVPWYWVVLGWSLVTWLTLLRVKEAPLAEAVAAPILISIIYIVTAFAIFWLWSIQIALVWPVMTYAVLNVGGDVLRWNEERRERAQLKGIFSQMVSPEVINHILAHPENMALGGVDRPSTVLFSDVRDFTKFSEGLTAEQVMDQLNEYFERMVACVTECKGTFHKFIGDAVMAAWGDIEVSSQGPEKDARNAVRSALMMRERLRKLNDERHNAGRAPIRIGIGLNHGVVQAGMLGSRDRKEFTVMGDGVNVASRLEGLTKEFKTDLAISETVRELIGPDFLTRRLGLIVLKGKTKPTVVFEVMAERHDLTHIRMQPEAIDRYEEAFEDFLSRRFKEAEKGFVACEHEYPDDHCVKTYLHASREFIINPPDDQWDGRIVMTTK
jgi:adenylate cyclase